MVNLSVVKHYLFGADRRRDPRSLLVNGLLPGLGFASTVWPWTSLTGDTFTVGLIWMAVGVVLLAVSTRFFTCQPPSSFSRSCKRAAGLRARHDCRPLSMG
ncbi:hypothetical protein ABT099_00985 [Streptomyces prasinus]|uniref:hypothetical protein n=1 Tax=Streptomyces prasinus TaxID=67345 RepID=UPI00331C0E7D